MSKINASLGDKKIKFNVKEFLARHKLIWVFALLVAAAAGIFSWRATQNYTGSLALTISRSGTQEAIDYKFDSYYALRATDEFGSTVVGWFKTPEIASAINKKIGVDSSGWSLSGLSGRFKAAKISPNLVEVRYGAVSQDDVKKIASAINQVIAEKVNLLNSSSGQGSAFVVIAGEPVAVKNTYNFLLGVLAGFLVGLVFGFFVQAAKEYFKN